MNTIIDFVLDKEEKVFYAVSEKGTEKLSHLKRNPNISAVRADGCALGSVQDQGGESPLAGFILELGRRRIVCDDQDRNDGFAGKPRISAGVENIRARVPRSLVIELTEDQD